MKLKGAAKIHYDSGPNMIPLVDIVMVILIFLMLTGTFATSEHFLKSNIPLTRAGVGGVAVSQVPLDDQLEIRVESLSAGEWSAQAGGWRIPGSRAGLAAHLSRMREQFNANETPTERIQIIISPGSATRYKHLVDVYQAAMEAQFTKIAFAPAH